MEQKWKWTILGVLAYLLSIAIPSILVVIVVYYIWRKYYFGLKESFSNFLVEVLKPKPLKVILFALITFLAFGTLSYYLYLKCFDTRAFLSSLTIRQPLAGHRFSPEEIGTCEFNLNPFQSGTLKWSEEYRKAWEESWEWIKKTVKETTGKEPISPFEYYKDILNMFKIPPSLQVIILLNGIFVFYILSDILLFYYKMYKEGRFKIKIR